MLRLGFSQVVFLNHTLGSPLSLISTESFQRKQKPYQRDFTLNQADTVTNVQKSFLCILATTLKIIFRIFFSFFIIFVWDLARARRISIKNILFFWKLILSVQKCIKFKVHWKATEHGKACFWISVIILQNDFNICNVAANTLKYFKWTHTFTFFIC